LTNHAIEKEQCMSNRGISVFAGSAGKPLADDVCKRLSIKPARAEVGRFRDGEIKIQILDNVRGRDVFIINPTNPPAENMFEVLLLARAARGSSADRVTLVLPYLGYNRQDRKDKPRVPISAKVAIDMLKLSDADRVLLVDLHSEATAGYFEPMVVDHLYGSATGIPYLKTLLDKPFVVASPDAGGVARARKYAQHLGNVDLVIFSKHRLEPGEIANGSIQIIGNVQDKDVLFVDDMIDSGGTMIEDAKAAKMAGAKRIFAFATHTLFSRGPEIFANGLFTEIITTDTIPHGTLSIEGVKITVCSIAPLLAEAIRRIYDEESLTDLILK
jgi:ribose-phosphate pyrophosphokinase